MCWFIGLGYFVSGCMTLFVFTCCLFVSSNTIILRLNKLRHQQSDTHSLPPRTWIIFTHWVDTLTYYGINYKQLNLSPPTHVFVIVQITLFLDIYKSISINLHSLYPDVSPELFLDLFLAPRVLSSGLDCHQSCQDRRLRVMATVSGHSSQLADPGWIFYLRGLAVEASKGYVYLLLRVKRSDVDQITEALTQTSRQ